MHKEKKSYQKIRSLKRKNKEKNISSQKIQHRKRKEQMENRQLKMQHQRLSLLL